MKCPNCNVNLMMTERSGIEIDYCPECRGVWLDRGELDKILERSSQTNKYDQHDNYSDKHKHSHQEYSSDKHKYSKEKDYHYKKKKGLFGELFDF